MAKARLGTFALLVAVVLNGVLPAAEPLPKGALLRLGSQREIEPVRRDITALPPDYKLFAAVEAQKSVVVWDGTSGRVVQRLTPENETALNLTAVSGDGKRLVTFGHSGITVWDIATARQVMNVKIGQGTPSPSTNGHSVTSLSRDGKFLAIGGLSMPLKKDDAGRVVEGPEIGVTIWYVDNCELLGRVVVKEQGIVAPVLSQDGRTLVTLRVDQRWWSPPKPKPGQPAFAPPPRAIPDPLKSLRVWNVKTGKETRVIQMTQAHPSVVILSPDGGTIAVSAPDGLIERWETQTGKPMPQLRGRDNRGGQRLAYSPDSNTVAAVGADGWVRRWANADGKLLGDTQLPVRTTPKIAFVGNEGLTAWSGEYPHVRAWSVPSGKQLKLKNEYRMVPGGIAFPAGGKEILTTELGHSMVRWDLATGKRLGFIAVDSKNLTAISQATWRAGRILSPDANRSSLQSAYLGPPVIYDPATGAARFTVPVEPKKGMTYEYVLSSDLSRLVVLSAPDDREAKQVCCAVWDMDSKKLFKEITLPAFDKFGNRLIALSGPFRNLNAISPKGTRIVTLGETVPPPRVVGQPVIRRVPLLTGWDLETGKQMASLELPNEFPRVIAVADDRSVVYRGISGPQRVIDFNRGKIDFVIEDTPRVYFNLAPVFSPDGKTFAVGVMLKPGSYGVRLYDWRNGRTLHTFEGHTLPVTCLAFSPDGKTLATGSQDTTVLLWDMGVVNRN